MNENIKKIREKMIEQIARKWGLENSATITFAILTEQENVKQEWLAELYEILMN